MSVLGVFALGTVGYFWYQLRAPYGLVNANPPRPAGEAVVAAAAETTAPIRPAGAPAGQGPIPVFQGPLRCPPRRQPAHRRRLLPRRRHWPYPNHRPGPF